jgi:hypothetical protein
MKIIGMSAPEILTDKGTAGLLVLNDILRLQAMKNR